MKKLLLLPFVLWMNCAVGFAAKEPDAQLSKNLYESVGKEVIGFFLNQLSAQTHINFWNIIDPQNKLQAEHQRCLMPTIVKVSEIGLGDIYCKPINTIIPLPESVSGMVPSYLYDLSKVQLRYDDFVTINDLVPIEQDLSGIQIPKIIYIDSRKGDGFANFTSIVTDIKLSENYLEMVKAVTTLKFGLVGSPELLEIDFGIKFNSDNLLEYYSLKLKLGDFIADYVSLPTYYFDIKIYPEENRTRTLVADSNGKLLQESLSYNDPAENGCMRTDNISYADGNVNSYVRAWEKSKVEGEVTNTETAYYGLASEQAKDSTYLYTDYEVLTSKIGNVNFPALVKVLATNGAENEREVMSYTHSTAYPDEEPVLGQTVNAIYSSQEGVGKINVRIDNYDTEQEETIESTAGIDIQKTENEKIQMITSSLDLTTNEWSENSRSYLESNIWDLIGGALAVTNHEMDQDIRPTDAGWVVSITYSEAAEYSLYNIDGSLLSDGVLTKGDNLIPMANLSDGLYLLRMKNSNEVHTYKLMR